MRFEFRILDDDGDKIVSDFTTFDPKNIGEFGDCEAVDMHTGAALRYLRRANARSDRAEHHTYWGQP